MVLIEEYVNGVTLENKLPFSDDIDKAEKAFDFYNNWVKS